ncbi:MAG: hypothetical protein ACR2O3_10155 [Rhizobiaceae bacterium]
MHIKSKFTILAVAVSMSLAPVAANAYSIGAGIGDNVFSWPTGWPEKTTANKKKSGYGAVETLKSFTQDEKKNKQTKK